MVASGPLEVFRLKKVIWLMQAAGLEQNEGGGKSNADWLLAEYQAGWWSRLLTQRSVLLLLEQGGGDVSTGTNYG